ncbi:MAG: DUF4037 domain-containing protein [Candidatus Aegiribacteria sp.]|nr:DUF4037 domain-containing protein [Candidatus Aegiribacteria sp.]
MNFASKWRIDLSRELSVHYSSHPEVVMVCLGGSPTKGISDAYSDLDIVVYWNELDEEWIKAEPLKKAIGLERTDLLSMAPGTFVESYHINGLKIDFGHGTMEMWKEWTSSLLEELNADPGLIGMVGGFLDSIPFYGEALCTEWKNRLRNYPDDLAREVLKRNMGFFVEGYLVHQCLERGDHLAYQDGMCTMLKRLVSITAALNRRYYSAAEPRWLDYEIGLMKVKPENLTCENIQWMLDNPGKESEAMLFVLLDEVLTLIQEQFPEMEEKIANRRKRMAKLVVEPCENRPSIP